jgi:hypothetical protein
MEMTVIQQWKGVRFDMYSLFWGRTLGETQVEKHIRQKVIFIIFVLQMKPIHNKLCSWYDLDGLIPCSHDDKGDDFLLLFLLLLFLLLLVVVVVVIVLVVVVN